ncbi:MAG TPA: hypothetical protein VGD40_13985 [Chryseosolibacter sp.]
MTSETPELPVLEKKSSLEDIPQIKRHDLIPLLVALAKTPGTSIRTKRTDRTGYGNFSTVVRATGALIMLRETNSGPAEVIPDLVVIQQFELNKDCLNFKAHQVYEVI